MPMKLISLQFNLFGENTYIIYDEASLEACIIDPGMMSESECRTFDKIVSQHNLKVKYLVNTHMHIDHVAGDLYVKQTYNVGLSASTLDDFLAQRVAEQARMFHLSIDIFDAVTIDNPLTHGDRLWLGDETVEIIAVPGHSPGSIALYVPSSRFVITGDALFQSSIGRTDLAGGDYATLIRSIRDNLLTLPPDTIVYPGHGPSTTIANESQYNPYL